MPPNFRKGISRASASPSLPGFARLPTYVPGYVETKNAVENESAAEDDVVDPLVSDNITSWMAKQTTSASEGVKKALLVLSLELEKK